MRRAFAVMTLCASVSLLAQPGAGDLWVGVLVFDTGTGGNATPDADAEFQPVGALVDGAWHFEPENDAEAAVRLYRTFGRVPAQWLPLGRELPRVWRGWLTDGRVARFELSGPFRLRGWSDTYRVAARIRSPRITADRGVTDSTVAGIAVSGNARVYPFSPFGDEEDDRNDVPPEPIRSAMLNVEVREIATALSRLQPGEEFKRALAEVTVSRLRDASYAHTMLRVASLPRGQRVTAFEGSKALGFSGGCTHVHSGGAMATSDAGESVVLGTWTYLVCDELHVDHIPLAVIERNGRSCWVTKYQYEDGVRFVLAPPGIVNDDNLQQACSIR